MLDDTELLRYSRQLLLPDFDIAGQERLKAGSVLVLGLGGLGCPAALYLAAAGVGRLVLADGDAVDSSNLQRQIAHGEADCGVNKAASAGSAIAALNSRVQVDVIPQRLDRDLLDTLVSTVDVAVDATDNYSSRFALNRACIAAHKPLVSAAAVRSEAQVAVFDPHGGGPCYRCLYAEDADDSALSCSETGVLAPLVGVVGSLQAMEALKLLSGFGEIPRGRLLMLDLKAGDFRSLALARRPGCPDCGHLPH
jgi:adenylyltransferase/sulfurtransferase